MASLFTEISGLILIFVFAAIVRNLKWAIIMAIITMTVTNIVSQIIIAKGGPGACVGAIIMPILGVVTAWISVSLSNVIFKKNTYSSDDVIRRN